MEGRGGEERQQHDGPTDGTEVGREAGNQNDDLLPKARRLIPHPSITHMHPFVGDGFVASLRAAKPQLLSQHGHLLAPEHAGDARQ